MRSAVFLLLRLSGLPYLAREIVQRRCVSILCYHDPAPDVFERHVRALSRIYNVISLERYLEWRENPRIGLPPKALVLTLDDGHRNNYRLRDVLRRQGLTATVFVCSGIIGTNRHFWWKELPLAEIERLKRVPDAARLAALRARGFGETVEYPQPQALSASEALALSEVADIQSHTRFHPILPRCDDARAIEEIRESKRDLEARLGTRVYALAYPNGDCTAREARIARQSGYVCALTSAGGYNTRKTDPYRLRRIPMADDAGMSELIVKASGVWGFWEWLRRMRGRLAAMAPTEGSSGVRADVH